MDNLNKFKQGISQFLAIYQENTDMYVMCFIHFYINIKFFGHVSMMMGQSQA